MISQKGEDTAQAIRDWVKEESKEGPNRFFELGKLLVGLSSGSVGIHISIKKFLTLQFNYSDWTGLVLFGLAIIVGLILAIPHVLRLNAYVDLLEKYNQIIRRGLIWLAVGVISWAAGVGFVVFSLFILA